MKLFNFKFLFQEFVHNVSSVLKHDLLFSSFHLGAFGILWYPEEFQIFSSGVRLHIQNLFLEVINLMLRFLVVTLKVTVTSSSLYWKPSSSSSTFFSNFVVLVFKSWTSESNLLTASSMLAARFAWTSFTWSSMTRRPHGFSYFFKFASILTPRFSAMSRASKSLSHWALNRFRPVTFFDPLSNGDEGRSLSFCFGGIFHLRGCPRKNG